MPSPFEQFPDPLLGVPWGELGAVRRAARIDGRWHVDVALGYPVAGLGEAYSRALSAQVGEALTLDLTFAPPAGSGVPGASHVLAVASGKGGVGKSTTAANLALALDRAGAKVGLLDADIYGPSQGVMLGVAQGKRPEVRDQRLFVPIKAHGIEAMSMSMLVTDKTPMVWRGPMASGALQQLIGQTAWGGLDYLVVDMPPGTGDIQLTLSQRARVSGAVIVTTPQDIALLDARSCSKCRFVSPCVRKRSTTSWISETPVASLILASASSYEAIFASWSSCIASTEVPTAGRREEEE